jgi:ABC-type lipoprotein release transport system permease subunit
MKTDGIGFWTRIALLFLIRSGRSTASLSVMVIAAVSALIFLSALSVGVGDAMLRNTVGLFSGHITGYKIDPSLSSEDLMVDGVRGVLKRVWINGILSNKSLDIPLMLCGIKPEEETCLTAFPNKLIEGRYPKNGHGELLISKPLAEKLNVQIGSSLSFTPGLQGDMMHLTISGIYQTRIDLLDRDMAFCPSDVIPAKNPEWSAAVFLRNGVDPQGVMDLFRQKLPIRFRFESWETLMPDLSQLIELEKISMAIVIFLVFGVVSVGIACSFIIFIIKNMREYGIMKAMGVTTWEMSVLIVLKVAIMNALACGIGLFIGCAAVWIVAGTGGIDITAFTSHNQYFTVSGIIYPRLTFFSLLAPPATAFVFSSTAAVWPAALLAKQKAADILRMI